MHEKTRELLTRRLATLKAVKAEWDRGLRLLPLHKIGTQQHTDLLVELVCLEGRIRAIEKQLAPEEEYVEQLCSSDGTVLQEKRNGKWYNV